MHRSLVIPLQLAAGLAILVGLWAQIVLIPAVAADEVATFPPYAPYRTPLVTAAIVFVALVQIGLVAVMLLLSRFGRETLFEAPSLRWVDVLIGAAGAATALTAGLFVWVTIADIPSPGDGMDLLGLWLQSAAGVAIGVVFLLLALVGRRLLVKAIALHTELDQVI